MSNSLTQDNTQSSARLVQPFAKLGPWASRSGGRALLLAAAAVATALWAHGSTPRDNADLPRGVAHAMGAIGGETYTNSREAFESSYAQGCRFFEADFIISSDGRVVAAHDHQEAYLGIKPGFTWSDFMGGRIRGRYTPLDADALATLAAEKTDWLLLTDVKSDQRETLRQLCSAMEAKGVDCRTRLVPHVFDLKEDYEAVAEMGFPRMMLALYRMPDVSDPEVMEFVRNHPRIVALNIPDSRWSVAFNFGLARLGVKTYVHTIDDPARVRAYIDGGAWGVVTDNQFARVHFPMILL